MRTLGKYGRNERVWNSRKLSNDFLIFQKFLYTLPICIWLIINYIKFYIIRRINSVFSSRFLISDTYTQTAGRLSWYIYITHSVFPIILLKTLVNHVSPSDTLISLSNPLPYKRRISFFFFLSRHRTGEIYHHRGSGAARKKRESRAQKVARPAPKVLISGEVCFDSPEKVGKSAF